jgi:hypothetical protein
MIGSLAASPPEANSYLVGHAWSSALRIPMMATFAWTGVESLHQYRMARRRLALGLSDPVVANRFLLWSVVGFSMTAVIGASLALHLQGLGIMASPLALFVVLFGAGVGTGFMLLGFLPPAAYLRLVRRRAGANAATRI